MSDRESHDAQTREAMDWCYDLYEGLCDWYRHGCDGEEAVRVQRAASSTPYALLTRLRELRDEPCGLHYGWAKGQRDLATELLAMLGEE